MSNAFSGVSLVDEVEDDYVPGKFKLFDTDIYSATIKAAYLTNSNKSKAQAMNLILTVDGSEVTQQIWMSNGQGGVTYKDKKTGKDTPLPGFNAMNALAMLATGKELGELDVEDRTLNLYDYDAKAEVPTSVPCYVDLHGVEIQIALQRQTVDKTKEKAKGSGVYETTGETRDINEVVKYFPGSAQITISELKKFIEGLGANWAETIQEGDLLKAIRKYGEEPGSYATNWLKSNRGQVYNKAKGAKKAAGKSFESKKDSGGEASSGASSADLFDD